MKKDMAEGADSGDNQHDEYEKNGNIGEQGYRKIAFGADDEVNYNLKGAYVKGANPSESENTNIHKIAKHMTQSQFYSDKKGEGKKMDGDK